MPSMNAGLSPAASDLGLGGLLDQQVKDETEEERKKRMQQMQQSQMGAAGGGSLATLALFGGMGAVSR